MTSDPIPLTRNISAAILLMVAILFCNQNGYAQCNALRPQIDISFNTDQDCAPVTVTQFNITYYFNVAQNPASIQIRYEWNDPANTVTTINLGNGLVASAGNTAFSANATFTYFDNNGQCNIRPTTSIIINGTLCTSSTQTQLAFFWGTDEQANANLAMTPATWDVCFDNPVVNAMFSDASDFNCNIGVEPDNPNRFARHVQFIYGTNHNPLATIRNLSLNDGSVQGLTDATGNRVNTITRGTAGLQITGAYFGPIDGIPFPADGPVSVTFPMSAPADAANAVGNRFEITLANWNICNPWNGDAINPNYEDAIFTTGYITIVAAPNPSFITRNSGGTQTKNFCIDEVISFINQTPNVAAYNYTWEFYDDAAGTTLLATRNQRNPTFSFSTGGQKLIRVRASNPTAQGSCEEIFEDVISVTPSLIAAIGVTDVSNVPITPMFCQNASAPLNSFVVRFSDISAGTITANSQWRWEFTNQSNVVVRREPAAGFSNTQLGPFDITYTNVGVYRARLFIRDVVTNCQTTADVMVRVLANPVANFSANRVCEGTATSFNDISTINSINGHQINSREWDLNYDGVTFNADPSLNNRQNFTHTFPAAGTYTVALRVGTNMGGCSAIFSQTITIDPLPNASFSLNVNSGCSVLPVTLTNTSIGGQPDVIDRYVWEVNLGGVFQVDSIQRPTDPDFSASYTRNFENFTAANKSYQVRLRVFTQNGCERVSAPQTITVFPGPKSGFIALNYSPFNDNCSPQTVNFTVDNETRALNPSDYRWRVRDNNTGQILVDQSTGTTPTFSHQFVNGTQSIKNYEVGLRTTLPSRCNRDSAKTVRINPVPTANFAIDTLAFTCDEMSFKYEAAQKGLSEYNWTLSVNGVPLFSQTTASDLFTYDFDRVSQLQNVQVQLQTRNIANCQSSIATDAVIVPVNDNITASFIASPPTQTLPNSTVALTNNSNPGPFQFLWDFGDGTTSTAVNPGSHTYTTYGNYTIQLTVRSNTCERVQLFPIVIEPILPQLDFVFTESGCAPLTVNFTNNSLYADASTYRWEFGANQGTSNAVNPTYTYTEPGIYSVTLYASNILGREVSLTKGVIEVYETPTAQFAVNTNKVYIPGGKVFTDNRTLGATSYAWDFGDGQTSTLFEPIISYTTAGIYTITLKATSTNGCEDSAVLESIIEAEEAAEILLPNAFTPGKNGPGSGDGVNDLFRPLVRGVTDFHMLIFNRWGELLFETRNTEDGWDGYFKGKLCPQDVYVYRVTARLENGDLISRTGDIHLMQ